MPLLEPDHLAICAETLAEGVAYVEDLLGVPLEPGGEHVFMGTHNRLLSLGPEFYLEVIAINPDAASPGRARWFDMDRFSGPPRLTNWICRTQDLPRALALAPAGIGRVIPAARGDLRWQMVVPDDGRLPFDGAFPALIAWEGTAHPSGQLPDRGCRMTALEIQHPQADDLGRRLQTMLDMANNQVRSGPEKRLIATIDTPTGPKILR
ncbi:MAG: VOC family protein [Paracoccaceae bacterium]